MPRPRMFDEPVTISLRLERYLVETLKDMAFKRQTTLSDLIRTIIKNSLAAKRPERSKEENEPFKKIDFREIGLTDEYYYIRDELLDIQSKIESSIERLGTWPSELIKKFKTTLRKARQVLLRMNKVPDYIYDDYDDFKKWVNSLWKRKIEVIRRMKKRRTN